MSSNVAIYTSHNWRMLCILRALLLNHTELRLSQKGNCVSEFFHTVNEMLRSGLEKTENKTRFDLAASRPTLRDRVGRLKARAAVYKKMGFSKKIKALKDCRKRQWHDTWGSQLPAGAAERARAVSTSVLKCFPQFINGSALHIEISNNEVKVKLLPPPDVLEADEDLENE